MSHPLLSSTEQEKIKAAIQNAEHSTSGEIRVHVSKHCKENVLDCAAFWFEKLKMHKTEQRNGILFYLAIEDQKFAILGDAGINNKVPNNFWDEIKEQMQNAFKQNLFAEGLSQGIEKAGEQLQQHFPYQQNDINELDDEISFE
jgi:uncharacterized membrane protein